MVTPNIRTAFIKAATWHGALDEAEQLLALHPDLSSHDVFTAAITGNAEAVRLLLAENPANATAVSEPYGGNALVYLCLSKYLRLDSSRSEHFLQAATALLNAGADANAGFWTTDQHPEFETALYGAAGVAHHGAMTRLLLAYGADPNDEEAVYHSPEMYDNDAMKALVETGAITKENLVLMLIRKQDWHDEPGVAYLLDKGADPNKTGKNGWYPLHHALARSNGLSIIKCLLDYNADPRLVSDGLDAISRAAREGRSDVLNLFSQKGWAIELHGVDRLIAACAMNDDVTIQTIIQQSPLYLQELMSMGGQLLARFCLNNNIAGVRLLLQMGVDVNTPYDTGDVYFGIPPGSLPIHIAAWLGHSPLVKLLIEKGAIVDMPDKNGQTPLALAVKACVDSYWTYRRTPDSVKALRDAGASTNGIPFPCGYAAVDALLFNQI